MIRKTQKMLAALSAVIAVAGCSQSAPALTVPTMTLAPPSPAGMQELAPQPVRVPTPETDECNRTASLRPFSDKADADAAAQPVERPVVLGSSAVDFYA